MRKVWLAVLLLPILAVAALFLIPIETWNPGAPGLASGRIEVGYEAGLAPRGTFLDCGAGELRAEAHYSWKGGGRLHVELVAATERGPARATIILWRALTGAVRAAAIVRAPRGGEPQRLGLRGRVVLRSKDYGVKQLPAGSFELVLAAGERWRGAFVP